MSQLAAEKEARKQNSYRSTETRQRSELDWRRRFVGVGIGIGVGRRRGHVDAGRSSAVLLASRFQTVGLAAVLLSSLRGSNQPQEISNRPQPASETPASTDRHVRR